MTMKNTCALLLAAGLAAAQNPTVSVLLPLVDQQTIDGSVISAGPTATSYFVSCPPGEDSNDCGLGDGMQVLYGPSIVTLTASYGSDYIYLSCDLDPAKDVATCADRESESGSVTKESTTITGYKSLIVPVIITAGADKLSLTGAGATASSTTAPTASQTSASTLATATNSQGSSSSSGSSSTGSSTGTNSASTSHTSSSSTGGVPQITQNAVVMGAAALLGGAMLL